MFYGSIAQNSFLSPWSQVCNWLPGKKEPVIWPLLRLMLCYRNPINRYLKIWILRTVCYFFFECFTYLFLFFNIFIVVQVQFSAFPPPQPLHTTPALYLFLERGERKKKERERNISVWLPLVCPTLGTWLTTQACALTGSQTGDALVCLSALNPLSYTGQGCLLFLNSFVENKLIHVKEIYTWSYLIIK